MLNLYCATAAEDYRSHLATDVSAECLVVVPNEISAFSWRRAFQAACSSGLVRSFDELIDELVRPSNGFPAETLSAEICRAVYRDLLEASPEKYDFLVGKNSVPRLTQAVLSRIIASAEALMQEEPGSEIGRPESPRRRQLQALLDEFQGRLERAGQRRDKVAVWQGIIDLTADDFQRSYAGVQHVVFVDFDHFVDEVYLAIAALAKLAGRCDVLLNMDPRLVPPGPSPLDSAYQRLYDMAENIEGPEDGDDAPPLLPEAERPPLLVTAPNVSAEIASSARYLSHKIAQTASASPRPLHVVALADSNTYITRVEEAFRSNGVSWYSLEGDQCLRGPEFMLLERLGQCVRREVSGDKISDLLRAPGFSSLIPLEISTVEAWDLASRLDAILAGTGLLTGWGAVLKGVGAAIKKQHVQRQRTTHWSEEEQALDDRLQAVLHATFQVIETFSERHGVAHWADKTANLLEQLAFHYRSNQDGDRGQRRSRELLAMLGEMRAAAEVVSLEPIAFPRFVALFRTVMYGAREPVDFDAAAGRDIILCSPEMASYLSGDSVTLLGFNDGAFPRFARSDVSFFGNDGPKDQAPYRGRQWHVLTRLLSSFSSCELWMPAREGTEPLLPSQFAELLQREKAVDTVTSDYHLENARCPRENRRDAAEQSFVRHLRRLELAPAELGKFQADAPATYAAARGISVLAARSAEELSGYDGILRDPQLAAWLANWVDRHTFSVSQLDRIVGCSFRFFADRMLNLDEEEQADDMLPAHVFGSFAHDVLARFYRSWVASGQTVLRSDYEIQAREELLRAYHAEDSPDETLSAFARDLMDLKLFGTLGPSGFAADPRPLAECGDVGVFGTFLLLEMTRGDAHNLDFLQPSNFEVGFGVPPMEDEDPLSTPDCVNMDIGNGHKVRLFGRIDRIDVSPTGVFAVTDYKTGHLPTGPEIAGGFRTQLPIYMLVAQELLRAEFPEAQPAGGLYYSLKRGPAAKISGVFVRAAFQGQLGLSGRGMKDDVFVETLAMVKDRIRHSISALRRGYLTTTHHNPDTVCRYCTYQKFCYRDVDRTAAFWEAVEARDAAAATEVTPPAGS